MARKRRTIAAVLAAIIVLIAIGYVAGTRFGLFGTAGAADTTAVGDSTAAGDSVAATDEQGKKDKKDKKDDKDKKKEAPPVPVEVARAGIRGISSYYLTTATLEPEKKVDILAKIVGEVSEVSVEEGDRVARGDLLCRLDDKEQKVALEEARINRDQKKRELERFDSMYEQKLISDKEYDDIKYQFELAQNKLDSAELKYRYTQIRAPFDGVVSERLIDLGENVAIGARLYVVSDTKPLLLEMYLPEAEATTVRPGQVVFINPDVDPGVEFQGVVVRIAPEVDERTGTVKVTAESHAGGMPGSFVRVRIVTDTREATLTVPRRSVVSDAGERYVFVAESDTVRQAEVNVGYEDEEYAEILSGIAEGDTVVTAGVGGIRTGSKVKVLGREDEVTEAAKN
jgi:membrane fusion protein (multidrug efflux system)